MRRVILGVAAAAAGVAAVPAQATAIYGNDFSADAAGFTGATALTTSPSGERFLGILTEGQTATLSLDTAGYSSVTLNLDLYGLLSLDGDMVINPDGYLVGPDKFAITVVGGPTLLDSSYSNFPGDGSDGSIWASADARGQLGYQDRPDYTGAATDSTYHMSYTFAPTGAVTTLTFAGLSNQGPQDEGFGIDNVLVSGVAAVPEPAAWAMLVGGFGVVGAAIRRRPRTARPVAA